MKKILLAIGILGCTTTSMAQELSLGINAGVTYSSLRGNATAEENDPSFNYLIGAALEIPLAERLSFVPSVNYERKSVTRSFKFNDLGGGIIHDPNDPAFRQDEPEAKYTLQFISVPLLMRYYFGPHKSFYINGGPYAAFYIGDILKVEGNRFDEDSDGLYKSTDFGLTLGAGTKFRIKENSNIVIELRNNLGLTDISDVTIINGGSLKTNSVNLIVAWEFKL